MHALIAHNLYITCSCTIKNGEIFKNEQLIFKGEEMPDVESFLVHAYKQLHFNYPRFYKMDGLCKLGWLAVALMLQAPAAFNYAPEEVCLLMMNSSSSLNTDLKYYHSVATMASPALFVYTLPNIVLGEICISNGFKGETLFMIEPQLDKNHLHQQVNLLMQSTGHQACIFGWVELLGKEYEAKLWIVEKNNGRDGLIFTPNHLI